MICEPTHDGALFCRSDGRSYSIEDGAEEDWRLHKLGFQASIFHVERMPGEDEIPIPEARVTGTIDLSLPQGIDGDLTGCVHRLPCCIKHDGPASVSRYFKPKRTGVEIDGMEVEEAYFRGRKLQGATVPLPDGYCGFILGKKIPNNKGNCSKVSEGLSNCWKTNATFRSITFWNHDSLPSKDDLSMRFFHWFAVSQALHTPVTEEDLEFTNREDKA